MNIDEISNIFEKHRLFCSRMISAHKNSPPGQFCVWNANIVLESCGKVWYGDLNITREAALLKKISKEIGEDVYVLREHDCRFGTEKQTPKELISKAVWSTKE